jgi:hypothetical protein
LPFSPYYHKIPSIAIISCINMLIFWL